MKVPFFQQVPCCIQCPLLSPRLKTPELCTIKGVSLEKGKLLERAGRKAADLRLLKKMWLQGYRAYMKDQLRHPPFRRRTSRLDSSSTQVPADQKTVPQSAGKVDDPAETLSKGEAAYQRHKKDWDQVYAGQFIAIHQDQVVAADYDKTKLLEQLIEQQKQGKFRAYIVHVGTSVFQARGPHPSQRGRKVNPR